MKVFGITGWKNSGKTTLVAKLVEYFISQGFSVSTIKHAHCDFDIDRPGSDSFLHRSAGAHQVMLSSNRRWALMNEKKRDKEPELDELLKHMDPVDLVLVEGFKMGGQPKIQVLRQANNTEILPLDAQPIVALASDVHVDPKDYYCDGPCLDIADIPSIANYIIKFCKLR